MGIDHELSKYQNHCEEGKKFAIWAQALIDRVFQLTSPSVMDINRAYLQLLHNYFKRRNGVTAEHRDRLFDSDKHICLYQVFVDAYDTLNELEVSISPQPEQGYISYSEGRKYKQKPSIYGLDLGEETDEIG